MVSGQRLLDQAWDDTVAPATSAVKVTVSRLRQKLGEPPLIQTVGSLGYRIPQ